MNNINPCITPNNIDPVIWANMLLEAFCESYKLLEYGRTIMAEVLYSCYANVNIFETHHDGGDYEDLSKQVTLTGIYEFLADHIKIEKTRRHSVVYNNASDRLLWQLSAFGRPYSQETRLFNDNNGISLADAYDKTSGKYIKNIDISQLNVLNAKLIENIFKKAALLIDTKL